MKKYFTFIFQTACLLIIPGLLLAQIQNAGFENWTNNEPDLWATTNVEGVYANITKTTTAHSGSYALRGEAINFFGHVVPPTIQSGIDGEGFSINERPSAITGYYQFHPAASGDRFAINVLLFHNGAQGDAIAVAGAVISEPSTNYTQFSLPFNYISSEIPDVVILNFTIIGASDKSSNPTPGSYYILDDLAFSNTVGVEEDRNNIPAEFRLYPNYPNPFNPSTNISFTVPADGKALLKIYDVLGREVSTLFEGFVNAGNIYNIKFNAGNLTSGIYFSRLEFIPSDGSSNILRSINKMVLTK